MKAIIRMTLAAAAITLSVTASAQNSNSSYFMEGALNRHMANPAFAPQQSYVAMPALGNFNVGATANFNIGDVLFQRNGKTVTYLHPDVSVAEALSGFKDNNKFRTDVNIQILGVGFKAFGGFNTVTINARAMAGFQMPYELFAIAKNLENRSYDIGEASVFAQSFAEIALGHSRQITEDLRIGAKAKVLLGIARGKAELTDLKLDLAGDNEWTATAHANVEANLKGLKIKNDYKNYKEEGREPYLTIDDIDIDDFKPIGGFGLALDLGAEYDFKELVPGLKASLAILDLGFINWKESHVVENNGKDFTFNGFKNIKVKGGSNDPSEKKLDDQADEMVDKLTDLYRLEYKDDQGSKSHGIGATMNVGVEYALPFYEKVRVGLLSSSRLQKDFGWNEERLSLNYAPAHWFEMNVNGAVGTFGPSFGWMLNVHPSGFNLYLAMDRTLGKVSKQFAPMNKGTQVSVGINFPLQSARKKTN